MTSRVFSVRIALTGFTGAILLTEAIFAQSSWPVAGHDVSNTRSQRSETQIGPANVGRLVAKWVFTTGSDVPGTPTVVGRAVSFPDWAVAPHVIHTDTVTVSLS